MTRPRAAAPRLRMKDLCERTGLTRQAIHFYIQAGLVPEGDKTGKNMAWYGPQHVERLQLIRRLQEERFLPLKAIRAMLDGETDQLPDSQRNLLAEISTLLPPALTGGERGVPVADVLARYDVTAAELEEMIAMGFLPVRGRGAAREVAADAVHLLDLWTQLRGLGYSRERGFGVDDLVPFAAAAEALVEQETRMLLARMADLGAQAGAPLIERTLPIIHALLVHFHTAAVRAVFARIAAERAAQPKD